MRTVASWWGVAALAAVVGFGFQGSRGLYGSTEGRYAEVAREMLVSGNYLEPTLSGKPHWTKPPLTYAAIALSMRAFGVNTWAVRAPYAVAFVLTALLVGALGTLLYDRATGVLAGLVYATAAFPAFAAHFVSTDTFLALCEVAAVTAYAWAYRSAATQRSARARAGIILMYTALGLAFATKGPVGLLPLLALIPWHRRQTVRPRLLDPVGIGLGVCIGGWWYTVVALRHPELWEYFIGEEVVARVATADAHRNPEWYKPFIVYLPALAATVAPWVLIVWRDLRALPLLSWRFWAAHMRTAAPHALLLLWVLGPLAVFTLSRSRLALYVLPLCAPLAVLIARACIRRAGGGGPTRDHVRLACVLAGLLVIGKGLGGVVPSRRDERALATFVQEHLPANGEGYLLNKGAHGLEFYLQRELTRLSHGAPRPWGDAPLGTLLARMSGEPHARPAVLIVEQKYTASITAQVEQRGLSARVATHGRWAAITVGPAPGASREAADG